MTKYLASKITVSKEREFELLRSPVITEKATLLSEHNQVTFRVPMDANKVEVRKAVENVFGVKVTAVNTIITKGKTKRFRANNCRRE